MCRPTTPSPAGRTLRAWSNGTRGSAPFVGLGSSTPRDWHTPLSDPPPAHLPPLHTVLGTLKPTFRHIPKEARPAFAGALAAAITAFVSAPSHETLWDLMALPKCTLAVPQRGGKTNKGRHLKRLLDKIDRFSRGEGPDVWTEGVSKPSLEPKGRKRQRDPAPALSAQDKVDRLDKAKFVDQSGLWWTKELCQRQSDTCC